MGNEASREAKRSAKLECNGDEFKSIQEVTTALQVAGLESSNLIIGIDFTKSNEWTGKRTFNGRCLHAVNTPGVYSNPYEDVIQCIGETLKQFDDDNSIPVYGFGDNKTNDTSVFSFGRDGMDKGFPLESIRQRYRELVPQIHLAGPTSFAPIIHQAINIVSKTKQFHILLIIADGQVTRPSDTPSRELSKNEKETVNAIRLASRFPLSIVMVGVGDGPWDLMTTFDDHLTRREFDNFQFVDFSKVVSGPGSRSEQLARFARDALMEVPPQYKAMKRLGYLSGQPFKKSAPQVTVHPAPDFVRPTTTAHPTSSYASPEQRYTETDEGIPPPTLLFPFARQQKVAVPTAPVAPAAGEYSSATQSQTRLCQLCFDQSKDTAFLCGHQSCRSCATKMERCHVCRQLITQRIRLYG